MKSFFKRIALCVLLIVVGWGILCNFKSIAMIKEHQELTVQKTREEVFDFLNDETKLSTWVKGIVSIEPIGEPSEGLGSKAKLVINVPTDMELVSVVSEWDPPKRFAWTVDVKEMTSTQTYTLEEVNGGTRIVLDVEHHPKGFFMKLISPLIGWTIKRERVHEMKRLEKVLNEL